MKEFIGVAVIATGNRGRGVVNNLLRDGVKVIVRSVYDPDMKLAAETAAFWKSDAKVCSSYQEAIETAGVDWVMVFSPNAFHKEHIIAAFEAGKHVFAEKPLATKIEDCQAIYDAHRKSGLTFATGFVLRYAPIYRKVKELIDAGAIGRILSIDANENITPTHGGYIMKNWRRKTELAGPHILEKCCHDIDLINWFCSSLPSQVAAFGGLDFFTPENRHIDTKYRKADGSSLFSGWWDPHAEKCAFESDKDLMDNLVSILKYRNGIKVQFQATMSNAIPERRMYISGSEGNIIVELYSSTLKLRRLGDESIQLYDFGADGHGGGDQYIMKELYDSMINGTMPKCGGDEGLDSAVTALAIDRAAVGTGLFNLEEVWKKLGR